MTKPDTVANRVDMRRQLRTLEQHGHVDARYRQSAIASDLDGSRQQVKSRRVLPRRIGIGKVTADIAKRSGAEQSVADRMNQRIAVRMCNRAGLGVRDIDSSESHRPAGLQTMYVVAESYKHHELS